MSLLETLGLKRKTANAVPPQRQQVDAGSMVIVAGVIEVEQRRKAAGLNPMDRMASMRNAAEALAQSGRLDEARRQLGDFRILVDDLVRDQGRWTALDGQVKTLDAQISQMNGWGDARAAGLGTEMKAAKDDAAAQDFAGAVTKVGALALKVTGQHRQAVQLREHAVGMAVLQKRMAIADAAAGHGIPTHPLKPLWDAYDAAKAASPVSETDPAKAASLANARTALASATEKLMDGYKTNAPDDWLRQAFLDLFDGSGNLRQKADYVRPATEEQFDLKRTYEALPMNGATAAGQLAAMEAKVAAATALLASTATGSKDERRFFRRYPALDDRVEAARKTEAAAEPLLSAKAEFDRVDVAFQKLYLKTPPDYTGCLAMMGDLSAKADAVLKPRLDAGKARIATITGMATNGATPIEQQQQKIAKSGAARVAIMDDAVLDPFTLKNLPVDEKLALLEALRTVPLVTSSNANAQDPKRVAQRKVYAAMDLDPAFVAAEKVQRKAIVAELEKDKEALRTARDTWTALTPAERRTMLMKMMNAQCVALQCKPPTDIVVAPIAGNDNGHYDPNADVIRINTDMPVYDDFELVSDLIFHENSHNYQFQLAARLVLPVGDANRLTKVKTDPPYTQARMFAANAGGNGYVVPDEEYAGYQKQPMEDHSWSAGPDTSRRLQKALA